MIEVAAFWPKTSKEGKEYFSGKDEFGNRYLLFAVVSENSKAPSFRLCRDSAGKSTQEKSQISTSAGNQAESDLGI